MERGQSPVLKHGTIRQSVMNDPPFAPTRPHFRSVWFDNDIRLRIGGVSLLLAWDIGFSGSYLLSLLCCPIWILVSVLRGVIERLGWRLTVLRTAVPVLVLSLVLVNSAVQTKVAEANAARIIAACEAFQAANGGFPKSLDELVPRFMSSIPRAKYCLAYGEFRYFNLGKPMLVWCVVPPYDRRIYDFDTLRWNSVD